jgi:HEAT repeat protein
MLASFADRRAVGKILQAVDPEDDVPEGLFDLLDRLPAEHLASLLDWMGEGGDSIRRLATMLVERYAARSPGLVLDRLRTAPPALARDLLRLSARALPAEAVGAALELASSSDEAVVLEVVRTLASAPSSSAVGRTLVKLLESPSTEVRLKVAEALAGRKEHAAFGPLVRYVERRAHHSLTPREAESYGKGLVRLSAGAALSLFKAWLHEKSLLERLIPRPHEKLLRWAAVSGLEELPGEEPQALLERIAEKADDDLRAHCEAVLERRRHRGAGA